MQRRDALAIEPCLDSGKQIATGVAAVVLLAKWLLGGLGFGALLIVPFWLFCAPVVAWYQDRGIWFYNKHDACFDLVDPEESPRTAALLPMVNITAALMFATFVLLIPSDIGLGGGG